MIDYDQWRSDIADALEKNGEQNAFHKAKIVFSAVLCIYDHRPDDETEDFLNQIIYMIKHFKLSPKELLDIFLNRMEGVINDR